MRVQEGVSEHHGELGGAERHVRAAGIESADALFKRQETRVDGGTLHAPLPVVTLAISRALRACQVDQKQLSLRLSTRVFHLDLADGVGARRGVIGGSAASRSRAVAIVDDLVHLLLIRSHALRQTHYLNFLSAILLDCQLFLAVEEINDFATVNFEETHVEFHAGGGHAEHIFDGLLRDGRYRISFARASLAVGEESDNAALEE
mmetsp:Transcript_37669/g.49567  ORF Transcript_37669/g.49567 Transcript_37669/m.49567 type:complete len:205 (-) Transcript_37669:558-1172(-)